MASKAISGVGTLFRRWDPISESWDNIAEINNITGPGLTRDLIDVTSLDSVAGYREFITGFRNSGSVNLKMNFSWAMFKIMKEDFEENDYRNYEIVLPDPDETTLEFIGFVTECPLTIPADDKVTVDVAIKISGKVNTNSGASSGLT